MKKVQAYISLALAISVLGVAGVYAQQTAKPAAAASSGGVSVNGVAIPKLRIDLLVKAQAAQGRPESPELTTAVKDQLVMLELVSQEAQKKGLDKSSEVATRLAMGRQQILADSYVQDYVKAHPVSDAELKKEYETFKGQLGDKEYKPRHILVEKEDDAKAIIERLNKGGDFAAIAKEKSKDTGSKDNGGDLDWGPAARFVGPFGDALKTLQKGQVTAKPVQTNFGFHVIKMDDVRDLKAPTFDEVKENFRNRLHEQQVQKMLAELRSKAKVVDSK
ncbi:MAG: peptidylprolyl isomerase [Burkholderiales bacterium]|nr:peptidylprolyl isomerase [Burkholderiales bacterium]